MMLHCQQPGYCTVMEYVAVCDSEPDVAVTVTVYVPAVVFFVFTPQPVMPAVARAAANTTTLTVSNFLSLRFFHPASGRRRSEATAPAIAMGCGACVPESSVPFEARCMAAAAAFTSVAIVRVEVAAAPLGVTLAGLNEQVEKLGSPLHARFVAALKPFVGVTVTVNIAFVPLVTVPLVGVNEREKSGGPAVTTTVTALDTEAALLVSPP